MAEPEGRPELPDLGRDHEIAMGTKHPRAGLTLLEAVIASAILSLMVLGTYSIYHSGMTAAVEGSIRNGLDTRARQSLDRIREELQLCRLVAVTNSFALPPVYLDHTGVQFRAPMGIIGGVATYGYRDGSNVMTPVAGRSAILRFVATEQIRENAAGPVVMRLPAIPGGIPQTTINADLNRDGDFTDAWLIGRLELVFVNVAGVITGAPRGIIDNICLKGTAAQPQDLDGDVDGDGTVDPIFTALDALGVEVSNATIATARKLRVTVFHSHLDTRRRRMLFRRATEEIRLENPQS